MKMCYEFRNDGCKRDNMSHTHLLRGLFLEEYFLKYIFLSLQKNLQIFLKNSLCYCVKVYAEDVKTYVIFKSFDIYL
jgi:hypothetical protein